MFAALGLLIVIWTAFLEGRWHLRFPTRGADYISLAMQS